MRITPGSEIDGVRLSSLKPVLQLFVNRNRLTTPRLGLELVMLEPRLSGFLARLAEADYLAFDGTENFVDHWRLGATGARLLASRIQYPMTRTQADALVARLIDTARAINHDEEVARVVTSVSLFGSYLSDAETLGDLDVVVETARRPDPPGRDLEKESRARAPESVRQDFSKQLSWPETEVLRRIRNISPRISLHGFHDIQKLSAPYWTLYRFDPGNLCEREADTKTRTPQAERDEDAGPPAPRTADSRACTSPAAPPDPAGAPTRPRHLSGHAMAKTSIRLGDIEAQHMWANGADLETILAAVEPDRLTWPPTAASLRGLIASLYARPDDPERPELPESLIPWPDDSKIQEDPAAGLLRRIHGEPALFVHLLRFRQTPDPARFTGKPTRMRWPDELHPKLVDDRLAGTCVRIRFSFPSDVDYAARIQLEVMDTNGWDLLAQVDSDDVVPGRRHPIDAANRDTAEAAATLHAASVDWSERLYALLGGAAFDLTLSLDGTNPPPAAHPGMDKAARAALATADLVAAAREKTAQARFREKLSAGARVIMMLRHTRKGAALRPPDPINICVYDPAIAYGYLRATPGGGPRDRLAPLADAWRTRNARFLEGLHDLNLELDIT